MKKRDTAAKKKANEGEAGEKMDKSKTEENDTKAVAESEQDKKKIAKKSGTDEDNENSEGKLLACGNESAADVQTEADDDMKVDKTSDNEDDENLQKDEDKEKRKKFVRLFCVHCRIESATFKVCNQL